MKILVTGGHGYLGTRLTKVLGADARSRRDGFDILDANSISEAAEYDVVIHLAAMVDKDPARDAEIFRTNVEGTVNLLNAVKEESVFIFASTREVYGRFADKYQLVPETCPTTFAGQSSYEWSKLVAERYVEYFAAKRRLRSCIFRLSTIYSPRGGDAIPNFVGHYADMINLGERFALPGDGAAIRDLLFVDDLADACTAFADSVIRNGLYNLGGGPANAVSLTELIAKMEEAAGLQAVIDRDASIPMPVPKRYVSDLSLVTQELDWQPKTKLADGLAALFGGTTTNQ